MKKILSAYPDYGKAPPEYVVGFSEALSYLSADDINALAHPTEGLATRCQYLPTIADVHALLRERKAKAEQFKPAPTAYRKIEDDPEAPWNRETDYERKKRVVVEFLGYNPDVKGRGVTVHGDGVTKPTQPTADDLASLKSSLPAPGPPTRELLQYIADNPFPYREGPQ